jgi:hypothetical protein
MTRFHEQPKVWTPRADQEKVMEWLAPRSRGALWLSTGSGKTVLALSWLAQKMDDCILSRVLIVAPKLVAQHGWPLQVQLWGHVQHLASEVRVIGFEDLNLGRKVATGRSVATLTDGAARSGRANVGAGSTGVASVSGNRALDFRDKRATKSHLLSLRERIHVCSWDAFPWLAKAYGKNWPYDGVVFDESSFLRDQQSERGKAARHAVHRTGVVEHVLELTATPAANHQEAVFAQLDLIEPGLLGRTLTDFRETWCVPDSRNWQTGQVYSWKVAPPLADAFRAKCASVAISVPRSLAVPLVEAPVWVDPSDAASGAAGAFLRDSLWRGIACGSAAVQHAKLRQCASGFVYDETGEGLDLDTVKLDRLEELVQAIDGPVLVAYQWIHELGRMRGRFGKHVADIREPGAKAAFEAGKLRLLAVHPASAGHGVDGLQRISQHLVWTSVPEDRELYDQTNGRLHRHGTQADTVFAHVLVARGTREHDIWADVLPGKLTVQDLLLRAAMPEAA